MPFIPLEMSPTCRIHWNGLIRSLLGGSTSVINYFCSINTWHHNTECNASLILHTTDKSKIWSGNFTCLVKQVTRYFVSLKFPALLWIWCKIGDRLINDHPDLQSVCSGSFRRPYECVTERKPRLDNHPLHCYPFVWRHRMICNNKLLIFKERVIFQSRYWFIQSCLFNEWSSCRKSLLLIQLCL